MIEGLLILLVVLACAALALLVLLLRRSPAQDLVARVERTLREELASERAKDVELERAQRQELAKGQESLRNSLVEAVGQISTAQHNQLDALQTQIVNLTKASETKLEALRGAVDQKLQKLAEDSAKKLDEIRAMVDEKLQGVLEKRLAESFKSVSERLEDVHKGLGEMRELAHGVGDLKRVLGNVKTRGMWGEVQLGALLEQMLTRDQYETNVVTRPGSTERVEFAIKLPGRGPDVQQIVWLPIDAKFPHEDYERLVEASERADAEGVERATKDLEIRVRGFAKDIQRKYLEPPHTTDFGILFLPTEGLYAEIVRRADLVGSLQRDLRIIVAGPTTLAALLNSLQMGFRTLAIEQRSGEIARVLGEVKTEFGRFGEVLRKVKDKLDQASRTIEDDVSRRSRAIERRLRSVEALPGSVTPPLIAEPIDESEDEAAEV